MFIDTHCHLSDPAYDADFPVVLDRAHAAGVERFICVGADIAGSIRSAAQTEHRGIYAAIGIHPEEGAQWHPETANTLRALFHSNPKIVAYGEIGLDYHWETLTRQNQQQIFAEQIAFAAALDKNLPLIIHCREAQEDCLRVLKESASAAPVIFHCFTGDATAAALLLDAGYYLGIGGVLTYKKSDALRAAVAAAPLDRLILETDAPYLPPQPWRGKRNEPAYVPYIAEIMASVKRISVEEVAEATTETAQALFRLTN